MAYTPTEAKFKGGAKQLYVTYDLAQRTRGGGTAVYPKVKRVYVAGDVKDWKVGDFAKRTGRRVHGVRIRYEQTRTGYLRRPFKATRGATRYRVRGARVGETEQRFTKVVEVPKRARHVRFHTRGLPVKYKAARQRVA